MVEEYEQFCIITNEQFCCDVRLHCFLIYEEIVIMRHETSDNITSAVDQ